MIGIDITTTQNQYKYRGIGVFTKHIVQRFLAEMGEEVVIFGFSSESTLSSYANAEFVDMGKLKEITPLTKLSYSFALKSLVLAYNESHKERPITKFFSPFIHSGVPYDDTWQTYVYVHDLIQMETGIYSTKSFLHNLIKKKQYLDDWKMLRLTKKVMTNSKVSQAIIKDKLGIESVPIYLGIDHTIYNSYYERNFEYISGKYGISCPYFLYYGGDEKNKNLAFMLKAFDCFRKKHADLNIGFVLIGKGFENEKKLISKLSMDNIYFPGLLDDQEKINVMVNSTAFVHLSLYEGFGISVLENIACGIPCLISDIDIYRELFSGCAVLADTKSLEKTAEAFEYIIDRKNVADNIGNGVNKSMQFDWNNTFEGIKNCIYE